MGTVILEARYLTAGRGLLPVWRVEVVDVSGKCIHADEAGPRSTLGAAAAMARKWVAKNGHTIAAGFVMGVLSKSLTTGESER